MSEREVTAVPPRSIWTGKPGPDLKEVRVETSPLLGGKGKSTVWVEPEHERDLLSFIAYARRSTRAFWTLFLVGVVLSAGGGFLSIAWPSALWLAAAGLILLGITVWVFPFVTPQTIDMMGVRKGRTVARLGAVILIGLAAWTVWLAARLPAG